MSIVKVLIILILIYVGYKVVKSLRRVKSQDVRGYRADSAPLKGEDLVQDPFCSTYIPKSQAYFKEIEGHEQYFCSRECCEKYLSERK